MSTGRARSVSSSVSQYLARFPPRSDDRTKVLVIGGSADAFVDELQFLDNVVGTFVERGAVMKIVFAGHTANRTGLDDHDGARATVDAMRAWHHLGKAEEQGTILAGLTSSVWAAHSSICSQFLQARAKLEVISF